MSLSRLKPSRWKSISVGLAAAMVGLMTAPGSAGAATAPTAQITGDGSGWAANAVLQWISDVQQNGLQVVYTPVGSAQGRQDYANSVVDYAVSDIGYQGVDPTTGQKDSSSRPYAYIPIVAGGTAFPYHIEEAGHLVENLRLSDLTLTKIFTNQITNWDDPEITADNNGRALPSIPIIPVVHSEGAGTTAQFTLWLAQEYPAIWKAFDNGYAGFTEYWPRQGAQIAENGSDQVMNFVASSAGNGSIGVDEYSYALEQGFPVANIENRAGYFVPPTQYNVAVALTQAQINTDKSSPDYLLQNLNNVYVYSDPRAYPLSSYSYGIIPTSGADSRMTTPKWQALADYLSYSVCQGQREMGPIGYSPLPVNLVEASFALTHTADPGVQLGDDTNVASCNNPTFEASNPNVNFLAQIAPDPPSCDKAGQGPCAAGADVFNGNPVNGKPTQYGGGGGSSGGGGGSSGGGGGGSSGGGGGSSGGGGGSSSSGGGGGSSGGGGGNSSSSHSGSGSGNSGSNSSGGNRTGNNSGGSGSGSGVTTTTFVPNVVAANLGAPRVGHDSIEVVGLIALIVILAVPPYMTGRRRRATESQGADK